MALSVTTRALTWKYLLDPDCALVLARLVREMGVLARTLGIGLSDRSVLPVASLCAGSETQAVAAIMKAGRSEEHTSELQSRLHLVCRLLLEKKKKKRTARVIVAPHATTTVTSLYSQSQI